MLKTLKSLLADNLKTSSQNPPADEHLLPAAAAMLLLEVAWADHDMSDAEIELVTTRVRDLFKLDDQLVAEVVADARVRHESSVGVYEYTQTLHAGLDDTEKYALLVALWQLALSDHELHTLEEHSIRRISELLYVPHKRFIRAKLEARDKLAKAPSDP